MALLTERRVLRTGFTCERRPRIMTLSSRSMVKRGSWWKPGVSTGPNHYPESGYRWKFICPRRTVLPAVSRRYRL